MEVPVEGAPGARPPEDERTALGKDTLKRAFLDNLFYIQGKFPALATKRDPYLVLADFQSYTDCQHRVDEAYGDSEHWTRMSILNSARCGKFWSDRTIRQYCRDIWRVEPVPIRLLSSDDVKAGFLQ